MGTSLRIIRIADIDIKIHFSFAFVPLLGAVQWGALGVRGAVFGAVLVLLIFGCVALHELGHALVAKAFCIPVKSITLMPLGGIAQFAEKPKTPGQELLIALAGPAVNVLLALLLGTVAIGLFGGEALVTALEWARVEQPTQVTLWALIILANLSLAVFNMIPALPMDGGRVLRACLTWVVGFEKATFFSAKLGRILAIGFGVFGFFIGNVLLPLIAIFIFFAAGAEAQQLQASNALKDIRAQDAVNPHAPRFSPSTTLGETMQTLAFTPHNAFPVEYAGRLLGVATRQQLLQALVEQGHYAYVTTAIRREVPFVDAKQTLESVRLTMNEALSPYVAVSENGQFLGLITEEELARAVQLTNFFPWQHPSKSRPVDAA